MTGRLMAGPLDGVRVIDLSNAAAGPFATRVLAEQGADVIKVERPDGGDFMRPVGSTRNGYSSVFAGFNHNKRSIAIDLKKPDGVGLVKRLVATADVLVHNMRPGVIESLGLSYDDVRPLNERLIYVAITGWGEHGPRRDAAAYDSVVQAATGFAAHQADPATGRPQFIRNALCDKVTGITTAQLVTAALFARERTGSGQRVHVSMLHAGLSFLWPDGMQSVAFVDGDDTGGARATSPPVRPTADGWISITTLLDREFEALCEVVDRRDLLSDPRFATGGPRSRHIADLSAALDPTLATWPTNKLAAALAAVEVPHAVVRTLADIHEDDQVEAIGALVEIEEPGGRMRTTRPVGDFSATPLPARRPSPAFAADTDAILRELGLDSNAIERLRKAGVLTI